MLFHASHIVPSASNTFPTHQPGMMERPPAWIFLPPQRMNMRPPPHPSTEHGKILSHVLLTPQHLAHDGHLVGTQEMLFNVVHGKLLHKLPSGGREWGWRVFEKHKYTRKEEEEDGRKFVSLHNPPWPCFISRRPTAHLAIILTGTRDFSASFLNKAEFHLTISLFFACLFCLIVSSRNCLCLGRKFSQNTTHHKELWTSSWGGGGGAVALHVWVEEPRSWSDSACPRCAPD